MFVPRLRQVAGVQQLHRSPLYLPSAGRSLRCLWFVQPWELFEEKMTKAGLSQAAQGAFKLNYEQLVAGVTGLVRRLTLLCRPLLAAECIVPPAMPLAMPRK